MVSSPSPSSGIRSAKPPSRHLKSSACETRIRWFAAGPIMKTTRDERIRRLKTGPWRS
jgi:hypothetical protein